jgi:cold shock CspA family protein
MPNSATKLSSTSSRPYVPRGTLRTGRIVTLSIGRGHGFIRLPNAREVYFHRADLQAGTAFNDMQIGDAVWFELLEDAVSGARALRIVRPKSTR